jgi:hypothetical protein
MSENEEKGEPLLGGFLRSIVRTVPRKLLKTLPGRIPSKVVAKSADNASLLMDAMHAIKNDGENGSGRSMNTKKPSIGARLKPVAMSLSRSFVLGTTLFTVFDWCHDKLRSFNTNTSNDNLSALIGGSMAGAAYGVIGLSWDRILATRSGSGTGSVIFPMLTHTITHASLFYSFTFLKNEAILSRSLSLKNNNNNRDIDYNRDNKKEYGDVEGDEHNYKDTIEYMSVVTLSGGLGGVVAECVGHAAQQYGKKGFKRALQRYGIMNMLCITVIPNISVLINGALAGSLGFLAYDCA